MNKQSEKIDTWKPVIACRFERSQDGPWVKYSDHQAALQAVEGERSAIKLEREQTRERLLEIAEGLVKRLEDRVLRTPEPTPKQEALMEQFGDEMPAWAQLAFVQSENEWMREEIRQAIAEADTMPETPAFKADQLVSARDLQRGLASVLGRLESHGSLLVLHHGAPVAVLHALDSYQPVETQGAEDREWDGK